MFLKSASSTFEDCVWLKSADVSTCVFDGTLSRSMPPESVAAVVTAGCAGAGCREVDGAAWGRFGGALRGLEMGVGAITVISGRGVGSWPCAPSGTIRAATATDAGKHNAHRWLGRGIPSRFLKTHLFCTAKPHHFDVVFQHD